MSITINEMNIMITADPRTAESIREDLTDLATEDDRNLQEDRSAERQPNTYFTYKSIEALCKAHRNGELMPGDEIELCESYNLPYVWTIFQVAHVTTEHIYLIRKYLLQDEMPLHDDDFDLLEWLDDEYRSGLPDEIISLIDGRVSLPTEKQIHGVNHYGAHEDPDTFHFDIFKPTLGRVRTMENKYGETNWWWTSSPYISTSTLFCGVYTDGTAGYNSASYAFGVLPCFRIAPAGA